MNTTTSARPAAEQTWNTLESVLDSRRWRRVTFPFPHVEAEDVFASAFYAALEAQVAERLSRVTRNMPGYDALGYTVTSADDGPLALFHSRDWHDLIATAVGVDATGDVNIALHHHEVGSKHGSPHNDLNPGWFVDEGRADGITLADPDRCGYWYGDNAVGPAYERVRGVAILFYVGNEPWVRSDGGETGLYLSADDPVERPALAMPPQNNSMLAFECTPTSYHSFKSNRRTPRTSIVMWLHRRKEEAVERWGEDSLVLW